MTENLRIIDEGDERWARGINLATAGQKEVTEYLRYRCEAYAYYNLQDEVLWGQYAEDFAGFTQEALATVNGIQLQKLRSILRHHGVWVDPEKNKEPTVRHLITCANLLEAPEWTSQQITNHIRSAGSINSGKINHQLELEKKATEPAPATVPLPASMPPSVSEEPGDQSTPYRTQNTADLEEPHTRARTYESEVKDLARELGLTRSPIRSYSRELAGLQKLYSDKLKYGGELDHFDFKVAVFKIMCTRADVPPEQWLMTYPIMLRDEALDHFFTNSTKTGHTGYSFEDVCNATRAYFEGPEFERAVLHRWNDVTLKGTIEKNPGKSQEDCLRIMVTELRRLQHGLDPDIRTDKTLYNKLILACRDVPACRYACYKPADTVPGLINDLRSSIITNTPQGNLESHQFHESETEQMFTDRRYHSNRPNRGSSQPAKRCFVCKKESCWSTKHTKEEQEESKQRFRASLKPRLGRTFDRNPRQYITEFEGEEEDDDSELLNEVHEALIAANIDDFDCIEPTEAFLTSFGPIEAKDATNITATLAERSFAHALTADSTTSYAVSSESDPFAYLSTDRYTQDVFYGVMIDTGASKRSTAGYGQYLAYLRTNPGAKIDTTTAGAMNVQFGIGSASSIGSITVCTPIGQAEFHVVKADTPFLLCLADMDALGVYLNNLKNVLVGPSGTTVPVVRRFGHPFMVWDQSLYAYVAQSFDFNPCFLTTVELRRLHRRFGHPSADRLRRILERSGHDDVDTQALQRLTRYCEQCQMHGRSPGRFKFTLRDEDLAFNASIYVDVVYIDHKPVLHVIDEATRYQAARWLKDISAKHTWDALRMCWIDTYIGPPDRITHDAGKNFVSNEFRQHARAMAITTKSVPVEAHQSVGLVERAHPALRRAYEILSTEFNTLGVETTREMLLQMAVKAVNDTAGPDGLIPTLLVYGAYPRMVETDPPAPSISQRAAAIRKAMEEITKIRARKQVATALNTRNGPNTAGIHDTAINEEVLVWREGNTGRSGKWTGPRRLLGVTGETCRIQQPHGQADFRTTVVKPFLREEPQEPDAGDLEDSADPGTRIEAQGGQVTDQIDDQIDQVNDPAADSDSDSLRTERAVRLLNTAIRLPNRPNMTFILETLNTPNTLYQPFAQSRQKELNGLLEKGVFEIVNIEHVPAGTRIFNSRFVDEIKDQGTASAFEKSRLVVQAYKDTGKGMVLTQSPTIQRVSQRVILAFTAMLHSAEIGLYLRDITQAYTQSTTKLNRAFFVRPPAEMNLEQGTILRVVKPLYGVPEAGNHWYHTYQPHHIEKLKMKPSTFDPCLLYATSGEIGLVGLQTDDTLILASTAFAEVEDMKLKEAGFASKERERLTTKHPLKFNGGHIQLEGDTTLVLTQERQCANIQLVGQHTKDLEGTRGKVRPSVSPQDQYIAQRARGAYVATVSQPEAAFDLSAAAQTTEPTNVDVKRLNKRLQWQIDNPTRGLRFIRLDPKSLRLMVFTDASFANNKDLSSQIGYVVVLADATNQANILHWSSIKCKRVTRSVLASELYAMAHGFDIGAAIKSTIEAISNTRLPLVLCTDSKSLYDCLVKLGTTQEKRLMVDLMCLRQAYERREIAEVRWIDGNSNPADAMTKEKPCQALRVLIDSNKLDIDTTEWVERPEEAPVDDYKGLEGFVEGLKDLEG